MKLKAYEAPAMRVIAITECDVVRTSPVETDKTNPFVADLYTIIS